MGEGPLQIAFAVKDNKVERRVLKIGQRDAGKVEVLEGLAEGEQIVVRGLQRVRGGMTVNARPLGTAPPPAAAPQGGAPPQSARPQTSSAAGVSSAQAAPAPASSQTSTARP